MENNLEKFDRDEIIQANDAEDEFELLEDINEEALDLAEEVSNVSNVNKGMDMENNNEVHENSEKPSGVHPDYLEEKLIIHPDVLKEQVEAIYITTEVPT